jgi:hypothetical protein
LGTASHFLVVTDAVVVGIRLTRSTTNPKGIQLVSIAIAVPVFHVFAELGLTRVILVIVARGGVRASRGDRDDIAKGCAIVVNATTASYLWLGIDAASIVKVSLVIEIASIIIRASDKHAGPRASSIGGEVDGKGVAAPRISAAYVVGVIKIARFLVVAIVLVIAQTVVVQVKLTFRVQA